MIYVLNILSIAILFACVRQIDVPPPAPVIVCEAPDLKKKLEACEERAQELSTRCNPVFGEWNRCDQWVFDRWYHHDPDCEGNIYPPYEGEYE